MKALLLVGLAACAEPHVALHEPAPTITPAERVAMFHALERTGQDIATRSVNRGPDELVGARIVLANGTHVELPEDLLPVVAPDSDTARAARASAGAGHRANTWMYVGVGAAIASVIVVSAVELGNTTLPDEYVFGGAALATLIPLFAARHERSEEMQLRIQAFSTYTRDLGLRLDVCAHGLEVVPCEAATTPNAPGMTPPAPAMTPPAPAMTPPAPGVTPPGPDH